MTQLEMLPMTQLEIAEAFLEHFETEVERTTKAMFNAQAKVAEALKLREMAEHEVARHAGESVMQVAADIVNSGVLDTEDMTVTASVAPAVDPITGEVTNTPAEVFVAWPGVQDMVRTAVGPLTRYGELAADFLTSLPADDPRHEHSFLDYRVVSFNGLEERALDAVISPADYGREFSVEPVAVTIVVPV